MVGAKSPDCSLRPKIRLTRAEVAAALDRLAQHVRAVRSHEGRDFHSVDQRIEAGARFRLGANGIDAGVGAATVGQFLASACRHQ